MNFYSGILLLIVIIILLVRLQKNIYIINDGKSTDTRLYQYTYKCEELVVSFINIVSS